MSFDELINLGANLNPNRESCLAIMDLAHMIENGELTQEQIDIVLSVFDSQWSKEKLNIARTTGLSMDQLRFITSFSCVEAIARRLLSNPSNGLTTALLDRWKRISQWLIILELECITRRNTDIPIATRIRTKDVVLRLLHYYMNAPGSLRTAVTTDTDILTLISNLWIQELDDPSFYPKKGDCDAPVVLDPYIIFLITGDMDWDAQLVKPMGGNLVEIAKNGILHLNKSVKDVDRDLDRIIRNLHVLMNLSTYYPLRHALVSKNLMQAISQTMTSLTSRPFSRKDCKLVGKALTHCCWNIVACVETADGVPWIIELLEAHFLSAMLKCDPWIPYFGNANNQEQPEKILTDILPKFTVYRSVLRTLAKSFKRITELGQERRINGSSPLSKPWKTFKEVAFVRLQILAAADREDGVLACEICAYCKKVDRDGDFKRCGGCLDTFYCSSDCQKTDWKEDTHRDHCKHTQHIREAGQDPDISKRDLKFLKCLTGITLSEMYSDLVEHVAKRQSDLIEVQIDFSVYPINMDISDDQKECSDDQCMHMVRMAEQIAKEDVVYVRCYIARGQGHKVLTSAIPLESVLEYADHALVHWENHNEGCSSALPWRRR